MPISLPQSDSLVRLRQKYGADFPDLKEKDPKARAAAWKAWVSRTREQQQDTMAARRQHWSRHRHFRVGNQHISSRDGRSWQEPSKHKNTIRATINLIGPSLDFRHGVISEQKPGFRHELLKATIEAREQAEAQQAVAEHYYNKLGMSRPFADAIYHAQTDGCAFVQMYLDKLAGKYIQNAKQITPDDPRYHGFVAQGYKPEAEGGPLLVPLDDAGNILPADAQIAMIPEGDLAARVILAHDTMVDPEARVLNGEGDAARWFIIRRPRDLQLARLDTGVPDLEAETIDQTTDPTDATTESLGYLRGLPPFPSGSRQRHKEAVYDWMVYIRPDGEDLQEGLWRRIIGGVEVDGADELPGGVFPFARFTDGSTDPSFYPRPIMSDWLPPQISLNALASMIMQHARVHGMNRVMAMKGTLLSETYTTIAGSVVEYEGLKPEVLNAQRVSPDVWQAFSTLKKSLEDMTGWNDLARGQVLGEAGGGMQDVSGRAVLGAREMLERTFGPMVHAAAEGASEWSEVTVKLAAWLFGDTGRMIPTVGGRGDLAKLITREHLEGDCAVYVDPATMMPQPAQLRQQMLVDLLDKGRITLAEYAKRAPYAEIRNVYMGDIDHHQRAQWINAVLEENTEKYAALQPIELYTPEVGVPILWQDDAVVHINALNEIVLNERKPWPLRKLCMDRITVYEQLGQSKTDPSQPVPLEVLGVPLNRQRIPMAAAPVGPANPQATNAQPAPGTPNANGLQAPGTAPAVGPNNGLSAAGAPTAAGDKAQPLGSFGAIEASAQAGQQQ